MKPLNTRKTLKGKQSQGQPTGTLLDLVPGQLSDSHLRRLRRVPPGMLYKPQRKDTLATTRDMLSLAGVDVELGRLRRLTERELEKLEKWAAAVHLAASDNPVKVPRRPKVIDGWEDLERMAILRTSLLSAEIRGEEACIHCGCTEHRACVTAKGPCSWVSHKPPVCSGCKGKKLPKLTIAQLKTVLWDSVIEFDEGAKSCRLLAAKQKSRGKEVSRKNYLVAARVYELVRDRITNNICHGTPF